MMGSLKTGSLTPLTLKASDPLTSDVIWVRTDCSRLTLTAVPAIWMRTTKWSLPSLSERRRPKPGAKLRVHAGGMQPSSKLNSARMPSIGSSSSPSPLKSSGRSKTVAVGGGGAGAGEGSGGGGESRGGGHPGKGPKPQKRQPEVPRQPTYEAVMHRAS
jgi:hypothetical protein